MLRQNLSLAALVGILCGLLDATALQLNFLSSRGGIDYVPPRVWLIAPLAWAVFCSLAAITLSALRLTRELVPPALAVIGLGTVLLVRVVAPLRFPFPDAGYLVPAAIWIVVVAPLAWLAFRYRAKLLSMMDSRLLTRAVAAAIVLGLLLLALPHLTSGLRPAAAAPAKRSPNVVLIFLDTVRQDSSGLMPGRSQQAPRLAEFAASGLIYEAAFAPFPWTLSSHLSVVSGLGAPALSVSYDDQIYRGQPKLMAEVFRSHGYSTSAVVANGFLNPGTGFARGYTSFQQGQSELDFCRTSLGFLLRNFGPYARLRPCVWDGDEVTRRASRAVETLPRPYFLTLNYMDAHIPYNLPRRCRDENFQQFYPLSDFSSMERVNRLGVDLPAAEQTRLWRSYRGAIRCLDTSLGELFKVISQSEDGDNTIVAVVSDHGEQFGEHNLVLHGNSVYAQALHVPLAIRGPGFTPGRIGQPVSITDLYGTLLDGAGIAAPRNAAILPQTNSEVDRPVISVHRPARKNLPHPPRVGVTTWSVIGQDLHWIRSAKGHEEIYDYRVDPEERRDLAGQPAVAAQREKLSSSIKTLLEPESEQLRQFYSLGYMH